jgi:hypothetical protein
MLWYGERARFRNIGGRGKSDKDCEETDADEEDVERVNDEGGEKSSDVSERE